jgi:hypothetical protein
VCRGVQQLSEVHIHKRTGTQVQKSFAGALFTDHIHSHSFALSLSLSLSHTHTHTHTVTRHTHTLTNTHTHTLTLAHTLAHNYKVSQTHPHKNSRSPSWQATIKEHAHVPTQLCYHA